MARRNTKGKGHNLALTEEERQALATHYANKVIASDREIAAIQTDLSAAKGTLSGHFKLIQKHLGITKQEFRDEFLGALQMSDKEYAAAEKRRFDLHRLAGKDVPEGAQLDLLDRINDTVDDQIAAEADGYRAGRLALDPTPPDHIATFLHPDWLRGWTRGQEVNANADAMAYDILSRPQPGEMAADDGEDEDETGGDGDEEFDPDAEARALKKAGWADPTPAESEFAEA
ncbi:hypothetical protein [Phenylobacterium sp.]|uniref:hypothetical protein n=1 Tax=Phenylobacterium sp. TaxID=1871053 RepID=UPI00393B6D2F